MKLNNKNLPLLPAEVQSPRYDRTQLGRGILHIGVGGFHRSHQAVYTNKLLNQGEALSWGICGVGLRPEDRSIQQALQPQDYLYTLYELGDQGTRAEVVGAIGDFLLAEEGAEALLCQLAAPETRIVSLTITEGGYCTDDSTGAFCLDLPQIQHDLQHPHQPRTVFGFLVGALARRRAAGNAPFTVMSCDNLPHNGRVARHAVLSFAAAYDASLCDWIASNVSFPNSMVDRITPVTTDEHRAKLQASTGIEDAWPVVAEPFLQWVLEDDFCNGRPNWDRVGAQFTHDVTPYEEMKISLLNGGHMALAYAGVLLGHRCAHDGMQDALLQQFVRQYMDLDASPCLPVVPGIDLEAYKDTLIARFSNGAMADQISRLCSEGSSKIPKFILPTLLARIEAGGDLQRLALILAAWAHSMQGGTHGIVDAQAELLRAAANSPERFLDLDNIWGQQIPAAASFRRAFVAQWERIRTDGIRQALEHSLAPAPACA